MSSSYLSQTFSRWNISSLKVLRCCGSSNFTFNKGKSWTGTSKSERWSSSSRRINNARLSYAHGASTIPLLGTTLSKLVDEAADRYGTDREAVVDCQQNIRKDFIQLRQDIDKLATGLLSLGLRKGDRIGIWAPNCYEWILVQFAASRAGLILVCLNPAYQAPELDYCLRLATVSALVSSKSYKTQDNYKILSSVVPEIENSSSGIVNSKTHPYFKFLIMLACDSNTDTSGNYLKFNDILEAGGSEDRIRLSDIINDVQPDDPVNIQFTSGTTGRSKGVTLSHHNIINNSHFIGHRLMYNTEPHRLCVCVPLFHCFGNVNGSTNTLAHGICSVLTAPRFDPEASLKAIQNEKCTSIYGTPTMFVDMLNHPRFGDYDYSSIKTGIMSGAPCPHQLVVQVADKMNLKGILGVYGSTETSPTITATFMEDSFELRSETVGFPLDHVEVKIVDENGKIVPCGTKGELLTRGYHIMLGYWEDEEKTKEVLTDSDWYRTGDLATMDENDYVKIVGRMKDVIIRGGENIYPRELEEFFHAHPDIAEAHVFGIPDERLGEAVCVWIRLVDGTTMTQDQLKLFCKEKVTTDPVYTVSHKSGLIIAHFKVPQYVHFVNTFPRTLSGKIQKFIMREEMVRILGL